MNVIFLGNVYPNDREAEIIRHSKKGVDNAANNLQSALLVGLDYYYPNLKVITLPAIKSYPLNYTKIKFKKSIFSHKLNTKDYCVGFINIPLIKHISRYFNSLKEIKDIIQSDEETIIIIYSIHSPFLKAIYELKKQNSKLKTCLIVPDLPQYMSDNKNLIYRILKNTDAFLIKKYLKEIDSFILLSDNMANILSIGNRPWTRVEGIFSGKLIDTKYDQKDLKIILYSGTLAKRYGIANLIDAFCTIDKSNYRLWICGEGDYKQQIINKLKIDNRIKFWGQIPFKEILKLQKQATVLINPRTSEGEYTKYSFPSKTMEYLASGTPCIMHRLPGIPSEYFEYVIVAEKEDSEGLKKTIIEVCSKDTSELKKIGDRASKFILDNKNPVVQVKKIYDIINKL